MSITNSLDKNVIVLPVAENAVVGYSAIGSAKPILLTGLALNVYQSLFVDKLSIDEIMAREISANGNPQKILTIMDYLATEGFVSQEYVNPSLRQKHQKTKKQKGRNFGFWINVTDGCNLDCEYCYIVKQGKKITPAIIDNFIHGLEMLCSKAQVDVITLKFAGGEPTLAMKEVLHMANLAKSRIASLGVKVELSIITNGTLITPQIAKTLKENDFTVSVSLDGIGHYNLSRKTKKGLPSIDQVLAGIETLMNVGVKPYILIVLSNNNLSGLTEITQFAINNNLPLSISLSRALDKNNKLELDIQSATKQLISLFKWISVLPDENFPNINFNNLLFNGKNKKCCGAGHNYLALSSSGSYSSCQMTIGTNSIDSKQLINGPSSIFEQFNYSPLPDVCSTCIWRWVCCNGCEVLNKNIGNETTVTPFCELYKEVLPYWLAIKGRRLYNHHHLNKSSETSG